MCYPHIPCVRLALFGGLSLADLVLTWLLVHSSAGQVYESNPVANWWLMRFGWFGLAAFKLGAVFVVAGSAILISRYRPRSSHMILNLACAALALVVGYSMSLANCYACHPETQETLDTVRRAQAESATLDLARVKQREYSDAMRRISQRLEEDECGLMQAVDALGQTQMAREPQWFRMLGVYYADGSPRERLAASIIAFALTNARCAGDKRLHLEHRLYAEFEATFGRRCPVRPARSWRG